MLHNEEYILAKIKRQQETLEYLLSTLGHITVVLATSRQVYSGNGNPNTLGIVPDNQSLAAVFYDSLSGIIYQWRTDLLTWL